MVTDSDLVSRSARARGRGLVMATVTVTARAMMTVTVRVRQCSQINRLPTARGFLRAGWRGCLPRVPGLAVRATERVRVKGRF
jgi:hypothetical protein